MCGISGIVKLKINDDEALYAPIERMNQALAHRGPLAEWLENNGID